MSIAPDNRFITCDGEACRTTVALPVGLRTLLDPTPDNAAEAMAHWLFVKTHGGWKHFCPRCAHQYMAALRGFAGGPPDPGYGV